MNVAWVCCVTRGSWLDLSGCFLIYESDGSGRIALGLVRHGLCFSLSASRSLGEVVAHLLCQHLAFGKDGSVCGEVTGMCGRHSPCPWLCVRLDMDLLES